MFCAFPLIPTFLDHIAPLNESRPKMPLYRTEFFIDENKYFYWILSHNYIVTYFGMVALVNFDVYLANVTQHLCGMLAILRLVDRYNLTNLRCMYKKLLSYCPNTCHC